MFGMEEHSVVDMPQFLVPEFVGRALYGIFTIVMVIVLLNMLIAMITNSFQKIEVCAPRPKDQSKRKGLTKVQGIAPLHSCSTSPDVWFPNVRQIFLAWSHHPG